MSSFSSPRAPTGSDELVPHQQCRRVTVSSSSAGPSGGTGCQLGVGQLQAMVQGVKDQVELNVGDDQRRGEKQRLCSPPVAIRAPAASARATTRLASGLAAARELSDWPPCSR